MAFKNQWDVADKAIQERIDAALEEQYRSDLEEIALMELQIKVEECLVNGKSNYEIMNEQIDRKMQSIKAMLDNQSPGKVCDVGDEVEEFEMIHSSGLSRAAQEILNDEIIYIEGLSEQELKDAESRSMMQMLAMTCNYDDKTCIGWTIESGKIKVNQIIALKVETAVSHRVESIRREDRMLYDGPLATAKMLEILLNHAANNREILFEKSDDVMLDMTYAAWRAELRNDHVLKRAVLLHTETLKKLQLRIEDRIGDAFKGDPLKKPDAETMKTMAMIAGVYRMDKSPERIFAKIELGEIDETKRLGSWRLENEFAGGEGETK